MSDGDFGDLEEDVMAEILARLPIKSLMRFRCVCKSWLALISDSSHFAKKHLTYAERGVTYKLNFTLHPPLFLDLEALKNLNDVDDVQFAVTEVGFPLLDSNLDSGFRSVVGACNGLVCVNLHHEAILLWNPYTRDSKVFMLPKGSIFYEGSFCSNFFYGFGYDSASDDYKFIQGFSYNPNDVMKISGHVFSLKTGSWRKVNDIDYVIVETEQGLLVNGALHWFYMPPKGGSRILSFDLEDEKFHQTIPLPYDDLFYDPMIHQNCLCVCALPTGTNTINIWMMKEYGVKESWTEVLRFSVENSVEHDDDDDNDENRRKISPVCILESGVVAIEDTRSELERLVVLSNLKEKMHVAEVMAKVKGMIGSQFETVIYRETLVSPNVTHT